MTYPQFRKLSLSYYKILSESLFIDAEPPNPFGLGEARKFDNKDWVQKVISNGAHISETDFIEAYEKARKGIEKDIYPERRESTPYEQLINY